MKRLYFSLIFIAALLGMLFGSVQPVQAMNTASASRISATVTLPDLEDQLYYRNYLQQQVISKINPLLYDRKLRSFLEELNTGSSAITGVYVRDVLAMRVLQQPSGNPGWVSETENAITQFGMASSYNTTGLLAHNTHAGADFFDLEIGQTVIVVKGNGDTRSYRIDAIHKFQALQPTNPYSNFVDLDTNATLSATQLFYKVYTGSHHLTFQTCIEKDGDFSWGRLFVTATPLD